MPTPLVITNVTQQGDWYVSCVLIGSAKLSRAGGTSASASSGEGGWQIIDRSRQKAATEWLDYYPFVMTCTCLLDGGPGLNPASVEGWITTLESFEKPVTGTFPPLPPVLTVSGPVPHTDLFWVCSRLDFAGGETGQIRNAAGTRTQQSFTVELTEYSPSTAITNSTSSPAQQALTAGTASGQTTVAAVKSYTVVAGDTLQSIAAVQLGNVTLWVQIALLNNLSASAILTPGYILMLPTPS